MRYNRQNKLDFLPNNFDEIISNKKLVIVGCGGVGSVLSEILVRGGFKNLVLIDADIIDESNLGRQIFFEEDIGKVKSLALADYLFNVDSDVEIESFDKELTNKNINNIFDGCDLIVDATDNFETRNLINKWCEENNKTWIYNGAIKSEVSSCIFRGENKLFGKVFKDVKNIRASDVGILSSTTFLSASLAYNNVCKFFLGFDEKKLIKVDLWNYKFHEVNLE